MGSRVEQFEQIRRDRDREGLSVRGLAVRHGVHRRAVRQALASAVPPVKRTAVGRPGAVAMHKGVGDEPVSEARYRTAAPQLGGYGLLGRSIPVAVRDRLGRTDPPS